MRGSKVKLLSTTVLPFVVFAGAAAVGVSAVGPFAPAPAHAACNPRSPCAGSGGSASLECAVPRLQAAAACNPCAVAKACNPCNLCAAAACSPCNPGAACTPRAACKSCGAGGAVELSDAEAVRVYDCLLKEMEAAYARSDDPAAAGYSGWRRYSTRAYPSATHGSRYVQNYANAAARSYGAYENAGAMPAGATLAKDSFSVEANGAVAIGPLFIMEKMPAGFYDDSDDWRYTMIMPDGELFGTTKGTGSAKVEFCIGCHVSVAPEVDSLMFMPEEFRVR